jgi:hypothetical protein
LVNLLRRPRSSSVAYFIGGFQRFGFSRGVRLFTNPPIGEALALIALQGFVGAGYLSRTISNSNLMTIFSWSSCPAPIAPEQTMNRSAKHCCQGRTRAGRMQRSAAYLNRVPAPAARKARQVTGYISPASSPLRKRFELPSAFARPNEIMTRATKSSPTPTKYCIPTPGSLRHQLKSPLDGHQLA